MLDRMVQDYRRAADDAMQQFSKVTGVPLMNQEQHLRALRNMSESDLDVLAQEFGTDQVVQYLTRLAGRA